MDEERYNELQEVKKEVKKRNVNATAQMILDLRDQVYTAQNEMTDLRRLVTDVLSTQQNMESKINAVFATVASSGGHGEMGN